MAEKLDELKKSTTKSYATKSFDSRLAAMQAGDEKTYQKRDAGYRRATDRTAGFYRPKPKKEVTKYHQEETEMGAEERDLIAAAMDQKPLDFQEKFRELMHQRIEEAVMDKKLEVAAGVDSANTDGAVPQPIPEDEDEDDLFEADFDDGQYEVEYVEDGDEESDGPADAKE